MGAYTHSIKNLVLLLLLASLISACSFRGYDPPNYSACTGTIGIVQGK